MKTAYTICTTLLAIIIPNTFGIIFAGFIHKVKTFYLVGYVILAIVLGILAHNLTSPNPTINSWLLACLLTWFFPVTLSSIPFFFFSQWRWLLLPFSIMILTYFAIWVEGGDANAFKIGGVEIRWDQTKTNSETNLVTATATNTITRAK